MVAAFDGEVVTALWLGLATLWIDGTDGMLARHFRVKETIPWFDGARMDDIVDYLTYVFAPIVLLRTTNRPARRPGGWVVAALPLLASCSPGMAARPAHRRGGAAATSSKGCPSAASDPPKPTPPSLRVALGGPLPRTGPRTRVAVLDELRGRRRSPGWWPPVRAASSASSSAGRCPSPWPPTG